MKFALYFCGMCFLVFAAVLVWIASLITNGIDRIEDIVARAPVVIEHAEKAVADVKEAAGRLGDQIDRAKAVLPHVNGESVETMKQVGSDVGAAAAGRIRSFAGGMMHKGDGATTAAPAETPAP